MRIIKAGILDDGACIDLDMLSCADSKTVNIINSTKPGAELYAPERIKWVAALDGAGQMNAMPEG